MAGGWRLVFGNHLHRAESARTMSAICVTIATSGQGKGRPSIMLRTAGGMAWFADYYRSRLESVSHLVLYNSGSVLNAREMPPDLLDELLAIARSLPRGACRVARFSRSPTSGQRFSAHMLAAGGERLTLRSDTRHRVI